MYYVWTKDVMQARKFAHFKAEPEGFDDEAWTVGRPLTAPPPVLRLRSDAGRPTALSDVLLTTVELQAFSPRLCQLLAEARVTNLELFPIVVTNHKTGAVSGDYRAANIIGRVACVDLEASLVAYFPESRDVQSLEEFEVLEERIPVLPEANGKPLMFRLAEERSIILVHESIKETCERAGITGVRFVAPRDF